VGTQLLCQRPQLMGWVKLIAHRIVSLLRFVSVLPAVRSFSIVNMRDEMHRYGVSFVLYTIFFKR
jgi:hypothetical protein